LAGVKAKDARLLIVDDLEFMRTAIQDILRAAGFVQINEAVNGRDGLLRYERTEPDLVLLDIAMPEMDGITMLQRLMRAHPTARVVMCSALGEEQMIVRAIQLGARDFIVKPFKPERVTSAVRKVLGLDGT
jgi:two-component system chemotaxis response regulator CheY